MSCRFSKRGHAWSPLAGLRTAAYWDYAIRCCGHCGASGRIDGQGRTVVVWEPAVDESDADVRQANS